VSRSVIGAGIIIVVPSEQNQHVYRQRNRTPNLRAANGGATVKRTVTVEHEAAIRPYSTYVDALLSCHVLVPFEHIRQGTGSIWATPALGV
jgi:hypothetical protein